MKDSSKALFEYHSNTNNKLKDVTAQGPIGSLFTRSNSKAPRMSENDFTGLKVDPGLNTISNDYREPMLEI
jgi:3-deoxy-D-manno-octulosonic acid (KDO) 8-phosphate synthase